MSGDVPHRKRVKHYHEPGDLHELTFSCFKRLPLLTNVRRRTRLARAIDAAAERFAFGIAAFVFMPEHVHLLLVPSRQETVPEDISSFLSQVKRDVSAEAKADLTESGSPLLERLTIRTRPGVRAFRFWQEGPGYDRNLQSAEAVLASFHYIHRNPVDRGLVERIDQWRWSSARWWLSEGTVIDPELPKITKLPPELFLGGGS